MACGGSGAQATAVEFVGQVGQGVVAGGVHIERQSDEVDAFGVDGDGADLAAFGAVDDVEVAQGSVYADQRNAEYFQGDTTVAAAGDASVTFDRDRET